MHTKIASVYLETLLTATACVARGLSENLHDKPQLNGEKSKFRIILVPKKIEMTATSENLLKYRFGIRNSQKNPEMQDGEILT
jgi:hypothetical protein